MVRSLGDGRLGSHSLCNSVRCCKKNFYGTLKSSVPLVNGGRGLLCGYSSVILVRTDRFGHKMEFLWVITMVQLIPRIPIMIFGVVVGLLVQYRNDKKCPWCFSLPTGPITHFSMGFYSDLYRCQSTQHLHLRAL